MMRRTTRDLPPLNAIRAFEAAARRGSFKDAASELGVTDGAISRQIRLLEAWLGPPALFERHNRRVVLTAAGSAMLDTAAVALERVASGARRHRDSDGGSPGATLRVNALASFSLRWLLPRLATLRRQHPRIRVQLTTSNLPLDALRDPFDIIIRGGPDSFHGFAARPFLAERRSPVCSPALLDRAPLGEIADLARHTLLHVTSMPRLWEDWMRMAGVRPPLSEGSLEFDHFYLAVQGALDGLGVAMAPLALVEAELSAGRLLQPFPHVTLPARTYHSYVPAHRVTEAAVATFCGWLESQAAAPTV